MVTKENVPNFSHIRENNPSGWILRTNLTKETGGLLPSGSAANLDSQGKGIKGRIVMGKRKIAYPVEEVIRFLQERSRVVDDSNPLNSESGDKNSNVD